MRETAKKISVITFPGRMLPWKPKGSFTLQVHQLIRSGGVVAGTHVRWLLKQHLQLERKVSYGGGRRGELKDTSLIGKISSCEQFLIG